MSAFEPREIIEALRSSETSVPTRRVMEARVAKAPVTEPKFFSAQEFAQLQALAERLIPQGHHPEWRADIAGEIDERLAENQNDGWRYDDAPEDRDLYRRGLAAFAALESSRDFLGVLTAREPLFVEELLAEASEIYYSHPFAQGRIGSRAFADGAPPAAKPDRPPPLPPPKNRRAEIADAVVIGTGAGGAPLLARLAAAGLRVIALEAGPRFRPGEEFATDERSQAKIFWRHERLSAGKDALPFGNNNSGTGVGGSTLHYTAYVPRPQPDDFTVRKDFGRGRDWPISYYDLKPYLEEVEQTLGVSGPKEYPWGPARERAYPYPPLPLNAAAKRMQEGCAALGIRTSPAANAALGGPRYQEGFGWRPACTERGYCQAGCSSGAKASMDNTYLPLAESKGAEILAGAFAFEIERDREGLVSAVHYIQDGRQHRQACRALILCAGAVETPRLLLMNQLALESGQVGRNFLAHPGQQVWGFFEEDSEPYRGIPGSLISEDFHRPEGADFAGGYLLQSIGVMPVTYASQLARHRGLTGEALHAHMARYRQVAGINILGDCLPHAENFLELSDEKDDLGFPKPRVHFTAGANERRLREHALKKMHEIWRAAGATDCWEVDRYAHTIGTAVMGENPADSVVNPDGRAHGVKNLFIADNSIFPSALSVNPSLTIMANSLRIADAFLKGR